jgi:hypothetical protein
MMVFAREGRMDPEEWSGVRVNGIPKSRKEATLAQANDLPSYHGTIA